MAQALLNPTNRTHQSKPEITFYPLQKPFLLLGGVTALLATIWFDSIVAGFAFLVLFLVVGLLWRRNEPPILAFCVSYQWLFVVSGYLYQLTTGYYPGFGILPDVESTVLLSLFGILALAIGIRLAVSLSAPYVEAKEIELQKMYVPYDLKRLWFITLAASSLSWFTVIRPMLIHFDAAQILFRMLEFVGILSPLLWFSIMRQRKGYLLGIAALLFGLLPSFSGGSFPILGLSMVLFVIFLGEWRPWERSAVWKRRTNQITWVLGLIILIALSSALIWEGGLKSAWRRQLYAGLEGSPTELSQTFAATAQTSVASLDASYAFSSLVGRTSSGLGFFSHVIARVPTILPHDDGGLTLRALQLSFQPRFLFPDKPNLGGDSWLIRQYAGLAAAGAESNTSIGLTYMAEFYIDFGVPGMFLPILIYGMLAGAIYRVLLLFSPSFDFYSSVLVVIFLNHFTSFEGAIAKLLGELASVALVFPILLILLGPILHRFLLGRPKLLTGDDTTPT